jgi:Abortive infection alpha
MVDPILSSATGKALAAAAQVAPIFKEELQPAAKEIGKALTTVGKAINVALAPLAATVWGYEKIGDFLRPRLEQKLAGLSPDKIAAPASNVAGPALEALRFTEDVPNLREMYANVLAAAMNVDLAQTAHPAFVEIIKQLNPDEARILEVLADKVYRPVIHIAARKKGQSGKRLVSRFQSVLDDEAGISRPDLFPSYIDNLTRLGLVESPLGHSLTEPNVYKPILECPPVAKLLADINATEGMEADVEQIFLRLTSLGEQFVNVCTSAAPPRD